MNKNLITKLDKLKKSLSINENLYTAYKKVYLTIAERILLKKISLNSPIIIGLSGGQGSGKTTFSEFLKFILKNKYKLKTVSISIDDIYKTKQNRINLSKRLNKLFLIRGVPGTHDIHFLINFFKALKGNKIYKPFKIPTFDKSTDDRRNKKHWYSVDRVDVFILEGWCVGAKPEPSINNLKKPINSLEANEDKNFAWRKKVNHHLNNDYKQLYSFIDLMIYLKIPNFSKVFQWRTLQERKLANSKATKSNKKKYIMSENEIKRFIMYYERITKKMLIDMPKFADIIVPIGSNHQPKNVIIN
jgi:D-glycerate 3-kinase